MEIERKWMVTGWPEGLPLEEEFTMRQGYISVQPTVRIREEALTGGSTDYILCFKSAGGLAREEIERSIDKDLFVQLEEKIIGQAPDQEGAPELPPAGRRSAGGEPCGRGPAHSVLGRRGRVPHGGSRAPLATGSLRPCDIPQR